MIKPATMYDQTVERILHAHYHTDDDDSDSCEVEHKPQVPRKKIKSEPAWLKLWFLFLRFQFDSWKIRFDRLCLSYLMLFKMFELSASFFFELFSLCVIAFNDNFLG